MFVSTSTGADGIGVLFGDHASHSESGHWETGSDLKGPAIAWGISTYWSESTVSVRRLGYAGATVLSTRYLSSVELSAMMPGWAPV
eukprot:7387518-Prymnesium_polylepis.1